MIDLTTLQKGDTISAADIEQQFTVAAGTDAYHLASLGLRHDIEVEFDKRGQTATVREVANDLHICTDEEAIGVNTSKKRNGLRKFARAHRKHQGIDRANVSPTALPTLDRALELGGRILQAIRNEIRKEPPLPVPRRQTPRRRRA